MLDAQMMQGAARRQHSHHARPVGVQVCGQQKRALSEFRGNSGKIRKAEHAIGENSSVHILRDHFLPLELRLLGRMHQIIRFHHIDLAGCPQRFYDSVHLLLDDTLQFLMNLRFAVGKADYANFRFLIHFCHAPNFTY